jgi:hypothetical protein
MNTNIAKPINDNLDITDTGMGLDKTFKPGSPKRDQRAINNQTSEESEEARFLIVGQRAKTVKELIDHIKLDYEVSLSTKIISYWRIGQGINSMYKSKVNIGKIEKLADQTGVSVDVLQKAIRFASKYSLRNLEDLLHGPSFPISWDDIADNLWVASEDFIRIYRGSDSRKAFHRSIVKLEMEKGI